MRSIAVHIKMNGNHHQNTEESHSAGILGFSLICVMQTLWLCRWAKHQLLSLSVCCSIKVFLLHSSQRNKAFIQSISTVPNLKIQRMEIAVRIPYNMLVSARDTEASISTSSGTQPVGVYMKCILYQLIFILTVQVVLSVLPVLIYLIQVLVVV